MGSSWDRLLETLSKETYPLDYMIKVVGRNSPLFLAGCTDLEARFPSVRRSGQKETANAKSVSVTFQFVAANPEEIIAVSKTAAVIPDALLVL